MSTTRTVGAVPADRVATVEVPGSKSIANRALVCAALADGVSTLTNVPDGDDTVAMLAGLRQLGIDAALDGSTVTLGGRDPRSRPLAAGTTVHARLAGTTSRFLTALAALVPSPVTIDGDPPLRRRPFGPLHDALAQLGCTVTTGAIPGGLPATVAGHPTGREVSLSGDVSSQFVTALMLIGPYLPDGLRIDLTTDLVSRPYVEMTAAVMVAFGVDGVDVGDRAIVVPAGRYAPTAYAIEPDASSASYPLAIAAVTGAAITVPGLGPASLQGDTAIVDLLAAMGADVTFSEKGVTVTRTDELVGVDVDMADISDLVPTVAAVAAVATTPTRIRGVGFIRGKESDRLGDLAAELASVGVRIAETDDGLSIEPSRDTLRGGVLTTHHDHRLAMAFAVLGALGTGIEVEHPDVVTKSWPAFWEMFDSLTG